MLIRKHVVRYLQKIITLNRKCLLMIINRMYEYYGKVDRRTTVSECIISCIDDCLALIKQSLTSLGTNLLLK